MALLTQWAQDNNWENRPLPIPSAGAMSEPVAAPFVGTGSWFSCGPSAAEIFCREMESLADSMFDQGQERRADSLYHAAEIIRLRLESEKKRQPKENKVDIITRNS